MTARRCHGADRAVPDSPCSAELPELRDRPPREDGAYPLLRVVRLHAIAPIDDASEKLK